MLKYVSLFAVGAISLVLSHLFLTVSFFVSLRYLYDNAWLLHCQPPQTFCFLGPRGDLHHRLSCFGRNGSCEGQRNWMKEIIMLLVSINYQEEIDANELIGGFLKALV